MRWKYDIGSLEVITGPMFAGKSNEIIRILNVNQIAGFKPLSFKPDFDTRWSVNHIVSRTGSKMETINLKDPKDIWNHIKKDTQVIAFDEVHFFDMSIVAEIQKLIEKKYKVIVSGLDMDYLGKPFEVVSQLCCLADKVKKLKAVCMNCHGVANMTYRKVDNNERNLLGDSEYEARCRNCHKLR